MTSRVGIVVCCAWWSLLVGVLVGLFVGYSLGYRAGHAQRGTIVCTRYHTADLSHIRISGNPLISENPQRVGNLIARSIYEDDGI